MLLRKEGGSKLMKEEEEEMMVLPKDTQHYLNLNQMRNINAKK
jgi:hypothetical protein